MSHEMRGLPHSPAAQRFQIAAQTSIRKITPQLHKVLANASMTVVTSLAEPCLAIAHMKDPAL